MKLQSARVHSPACKAQPRGALKAPGVPAVSLWHSSWRRLPGGSKLLLTNFPSEQCSVRVIREGLQDQPSMKETGEYSLRAEAA